MPTTRTHTHTQDGPVDLRVDADAADVHVIAVEGMSRATVTVETQDTEGPAADAVDAAKLSSADAVLRVRVRMPSSIRGSGVINIADSGAQVGVQVGQVIGVAYGDAYQSNVFDQRGQRVSDVRIVVRVPVGSDVSVRSASGDVYAVGPLGEVEMGSAAGDVTVEFANTVTVDTASGDVRVTDTPIVRVKTASGDVRVIRATDTIRVKSASGGVAISSPGVSCVVRADTVSGDIECPSGIHADLRTVTGDIDRSEVVRTS